MRNLHYLQLHIWKLGTVVPFDSDLAIESAVAGVEYKLPLADSIIFATTAKYEATLWTQDSDFKGLPNVEYIPKR